MAQPPSPTTSRTGAVPVDAHSTRVDLINTEGGRILCVADVRGAISTLNKLAAEHSAVAIIHSGDFGFYEASSLPNISERTLKHLIQYSSLITPTFRSQLLNVSAQQQRELLASPPKSNGPQQFGLSEFPKLLSGELKLNVPVYTVWGACEDVAVLEKIRLAAPCEISVPKDPSQSPAVKAPVPPPGYSIPNLTVLDEATTRCLEIGGIRLRLFGLGGAVVSHKLFDNGSGSATIAGGGGTMWTTVLQVGELIDTAQKVYDPSETRLLVSHASPGREGLLTQLTLVLKADLTVSAGLHFRYGVSYNEFSVQHDPDAFRAKLEYAKKGFNEIWDTVKSQVENVIDDRQNLLLKNALAVANRTPALPAPGGTLIEESAWKNCWNWNLPDAAFGSLVLDIRDGKVGSEMKSQGFNFAYRQNAKLQPVPNASAPSSASAKTGAPAPSSRAPVPVSVPAETKPAPTSTAAPSPAPPVQAPAPPTSAPARSNTTTPSAFPSNGASRSTSDQPQGQHARNPSGNHPNSRNGTPRGNGFPGRGGHGRGGWGSSSSLSGGEGRPPREPREPRGERDLNKKSSTTTVKEEGSEAAKPKGEQVTTDSSAANPSGDSSEVSSPTGNNPKPNSARQFRQQAQRNLSNAGKDTTPKDSTPGTDAPAKDSTSKDADLPKLKTEDVSGGAGAAGESSGGENLRSPTERERGRGRGRGGNRGGRGRGEARGGRRGGKGEGGEGGDSAPSTPAGEGAPKAPSGNRGGQDRAGQADKARDW